MTFTPEEVRRVARLARLDLAPDEEAGLAHDLEAIATEFSGLARASDALPAAPAPEPVAPREDVLAPAPRAEPDAILAAAPQKDGRLVRAPRGDVDRVMARSLRRDGVP